MRIARCLALAGVALLVQTVARAQIIAPPLERRAVELGYSYKWFDRQVESQDNIEWQTASLYARYGGFRRLTLYAEGGLWNLEDTEAATSYSRWVLGGGFTGLVYQHHRWALDAHFTYNEIYDHDETALRTDHRTYGWNAGLLGRGSFVIKSQRANLYAGPMYVDDVAESYPFSGDDPVQAKPDQHWGVCVGLYATLFDYVSGFAYLLQVDEPQFRFGVALRSRGEAP
jgi:hypothetical protein